MSAEFECLQRKIWHVQGTLNVLRKSAATSSSMIPDDVENVCEVVLEKLADALDLAERVRDGGAA